MSCSFTLRPKSQSFSVLFGLVASIVLYAGLVSCSVYGNINKSEPLVERIEGTILLAGCIIIEQEMYMNQPLYIQFACEPVGKTKLKAIWCITDPEGYFILPNMPAGKYAISDIWLESYRGFMSVPEDTLTPWKTHYYDYSEVIPMAVRPNQWPKIHAGGIINFGYLIFSIDEQNSYMFEVYERSSLVNESFLTRRVYNRPQIPVYLLDKYPDSDWAPNFRQLIREQ